MEYGEALRQAQQRQLEQALAQAQQWRDPDEAGSRQTPYAPQSGRMSE